VLVRTVPSKDDSPPERHELRGEPGVIADALRRYAPLGVSHLQVQLRPNSIEGVRAFAPVLAAFRAS
jgi:hypothetical protein